MGDDETKGDGIGDQGDCSAETSGPESIPLHHGRLSTHSVATNNLQSERHTNPPSDGNTHAPSD